MTKLADLRIIYNLRNEIPGEVIGHQYIQATVDDLRSVLADPEVQKMLGAEVWGSQPVADDPDNWLPVAEPGNYLVVPWNWFIDAQREAPW